MSALSTFLFQAESGAVAVDWTVMVASVVGLGLASVAAVRGGVGTLGASVQTSLSNAWVASRNLAANGTFSPEGFSFSSGHYWNYSNILEGWQVLSPMGERVDIAPGPYFGWSGNYLGPDEYLVDMVGRPGDRLQIAQSVDLAPGQTATLRFDLGANTTQSGMNVYWGNQLLASFDGSNTPYQRFQTFSYAVTGGAGDGSNQLRFQATDGSGWTGSLLANVGVY